MNLRSRTARVVSAVVLAAGVVASLAGTAHADDHFGGEIEQQWHSSGGQISGSNYTNLGGQSTEAFKFSTGLEEYGTPRTAVVRPNNEFLRSHHGSPVKPPGHGAPPSNQVGRRCHVVGCVGV